MVSVNKLKGAIMAAGYTQKSLAKSLDMAPNTLNAKINGKTPITTDEAIEMCELLNISDINKRVEIFLT